MDIIKLNDDNRAVVRVYVTNKFKKFGGAFYPKASRKKKAIEYWLAARATPHGQEVVESVYQARFHQLFPLEEAEEAERQRDASPAALESSMWRDSQREHLTSLQVTLDDLTDWKETQEYQEGEQFLAKLRTRVEFVDDELCDAIQFASDFAASSRAEATTSSSVTATSREAKFEAMVGFEQNASVTFEAYSPNWGEINGRLEESFQAGIWTSGDAKAKLDDLGFSVEVQAALAMGIELNVSGELAWTGDRAGMSLGGEAQVFAGARAAFSGKLTASARDGLEASIKAGAFAGFSAEAEGHVSFSYDGQDIARVAATAGVAFGAGAEFEASIKAPIFGPTEISFGASLALGFGATTTTTASIDFSEAGLAASQEFRRVVYARTLAKGYQLDLINSDARNLHYLNKAIRRVETEIESVTETITSFDRVPMEQRSLLMAVDR